MKTWKNVIFVKFEKEEYETLNGFLIYHLDRIPGEDEQCVVATEDTLYSPFHG